MIRQACLVAGLMTVACGFVVILRSQWQRPCSLDLAPRPDAPAHQPWKNPRPLFSVLTDVPARQEEKKKKNVENQEEEEQETGFFPLSLILSSLFFLFFP